MQRGSHVGLGSRGDLCMIPSESRTDRLGLSSSTLLSAFWCLNTGWITKSSLGIQLVDPELQSVFVEFGRFPLPALQAIKLADSQKVLRLPLWEQGGLGQQLHHGQQPNQAGHFGRHLPNG